MINFKNQQFKAFQAEYGILVVHVCVLNIEYKLLLNVHTVYCVKGLNFYDKFAISKIKHLPI